jgi:hypothetical protein
LRRKILLASVVFLFVAMLATPLAIAKPTSAENNPNSVSFMWHSENGGHIGEDVVKLNPPWAEVLDPGPPLITDAKVIHTYATWALNDVFNNYIQIGNDDPITIYAENYEGTLYVQTVATGPDSAALNYRVYETVMWGEGNYIDIMCLERATFGPDGFYASGTFSGHGMIDGVKVQVTGIREGFVDPAIGFVLECYGTIRFAGNL